MESVMRNTKASPGVRLQAASLILDRAWGKPAQTVDLTVRRAVSEMSDSDLLALLHEARSRAGLDEPPTIDVTPAP
jgi:endonuclease III